MHGPLNVKQAEQHSGNKPNLFLGTIKPDGVSLRGFLQHN
jgi:hypothetical protein